MKKIHLILIIILTFILLIKNDVYPQAPWQAFLKLSNENEVVDEFDRQNTRLIFWDFFIISGGLPIDFFDISFLPAEIGFPGTQIDDQATASMFAWDNAGCISLYRQVFGIRSAFSTDMAIFPTLDKVAFTKFAVLETFGEFNFVEFSSFSLTELGETEILLNATTGRPWDWTLDENYVAGNVWPFKAVYLHEMGHLVGLGHHAWQGGTMVSNG
ncbi:MAG: hypothetical protein O6940_07705 [Ignavibacteria bacterium]|nr:hypothetical protein [Ignavibacteria bacterium]